MRLAALGLAFFSTLAVAQDASDQKADYWLEQFQQAQALHSYEGIFVYERQGVFSTHQVWHQVAPSGITERYLQLNGPAYEAVYHNSNPVCSSADPEGATNPERMWPVSKVESKQLSRFYWPRLLGSSRVANREAVVLLLMPRDQYRYVYEFYLDQQTGVPLMSLMLTADGQLLERFQYAQFSDDAISTNKVQGSANCVLMPSEKAKPVSLDWVPAWLPPGFLLSSASQEYTDSQQMRLTSYAYTDGLASFSLFVEPLNGENADDILLQVGPTAIAARKVCVGRRDVMATVVGEIPIGTAERIAMSVCADDKQ